MANMEVTCFLSLPMLVLHSIQDMACCSPGVTSLHAAAPALLCADLPLRHPLLLQSCPYIPLFRPPHQACRQQLLLHLGVCRQHQGSPATAGAAWPSRHPHCRGAHRTTQAGGGEAVSGW